MPITIGLSDGGSPHWKPQPGADGVQTPGLFAVDLGAVLALRQRVEMPTGLMFGLLVHPPAPEGNGFQELVAEGYERQSLVLERASAQHFHSVSLIAFGEMLTPWPRVRHAAAFEPDGSLSYYGPLRPMGAGAVARRMEFRVNTVRVKRP